MAMQNKIRIPNNWGPRAYQMNVWRYLEQGGKRAICIWHRRAGKDDVCLHWAASSMIDKPGDLLALLPAYSQGRKAIWTAVNPHTGKRRIDEAFPRELRANTNEQEMFIRLKNGATWQVLGSDRYDAAVGSPPYGITFSEWTLSNPAAWAYLAPIVTENDGWALFSTTARGRNHAKSMLDMAQARDDWFSEVLPVNVTNAMSEAAVEQQRLEYTGIFGKEAADALIDQEYYCTFEAAILGAYWGKEMLLAEQQGRICDVPVNPDLPIQTAWDIGVDDAMAIWCFQVYPDHIDVVDYYEGNGMGFDHYCEWLDARGYHGIDWMPHDAKVREAGAPRRSDLDRDADHTWPQARAGPRAVADGRHQCRPQDDPLRALRQDAHDAGPGEPPSLPHRVGREGPGLQEDARPQLGLARRGRLALPVALVARADARAGAGEGDHRPAPPGHDDGSVHGH
jgi:phage terminase large subunit